MKKNLLIITLAIILINTADAEDVFKYMGSFDNVKSTDTGHCYGTSVLLWEINNKNVIGLLNVDMGLCGDPPCSFLKGKIDNNKITFYTSVPIYNEFYSFDGVVTKTSLSGLMNGTDTTLNANTYGDSYSNMIEWCSVWTKIKRCSGVTEFCK